MEKETRCNIRCKFMSVRSGTDYDVYTSWSNAYCSAGKRFMYESSGDLLKTGDFPASKETIAKELIQIDCIAPKQKKLNIKLWFK